MRKRASVHVDASPPVSVIIPAYNAERVVGRAIQSVLEQDWPPREIIVVDDGSTDATRAVVAKYPPPVKYLHQANAGAGAARNLGVAMATGDWIAFLDADDYWLPEKLRKQLLLLSANPQLVWIAGAFSICSHGILLRHSRHPQTDRLLQESVVTDAIEALAAKWQIWTGTVMVRKDVLARVGNFDLKLKRAEDIDLWVRIAVDHPLLGYVTEPTAVYTVGQPSSLTGTAASAADQSTCIAIGRFLRIAHQLSHPRKKLLAEFAADLATRAARASLLAGRSRHCRWLINQFDRMGIPDIPSTIRHASRIPEPLLRFLRQLYVAIAAFRRTVGRTTRRRSVVSDSFHGPRPFA